MRKTYKFTYALVAIFAVACFIFSFFVGGGVAYVHAATSNEIGFDSTYVMDDLKDSMVDGKPFNLTDYAFDSNKPTKIFSFVEYCYSFQPSMQGNYGLYVYVYNPQGINFVYDSVQSKIEFAVGEGATEYQKYMLRFLNCSTDVNFEGLFLKYKVVLPESRKQEVLNALNSTERVYRVSGIELLTRGSANAVEYPATGVINENGKGSVIYRYSGYSKGYGADVNANTLAVSSTEGDVVQLEVRHTSWREKGVTNGKDEYTQDCLNSVYFAVPKVIVNQYGYLSEVHAEWRNAQTSWGLVTGNRNVYEALYKYVGKRITSFNSSGEYSGGVKEVGYSLHGGFRSVPTSFSTSAVSVGYSQLAYNQFYIDKSVSSSFIKGTLNCLNWLFSAGEGLNIADRTTISGETIKTWCYGEFLNTVGDNYGEDYISCKDGVKVPSALFDYVDGEIKDYHISTDDKQTLVSQKWSQSFWERYVTGGHHKDGEAVPTDVEAIHEVTDGDFGTDKIMTCDRLYISISDYDEFKKFYDENKTDNNVYLLRFCVTDYKSMEAAECNASCYIGYNDVLQDIIDTNAYFFKQSVFLDFDIIDLMFDNGKVKTLIPVVSNPIDIFNEVTPPVFVTDDCLKLNIIGIVLGLIATVIFLVLFGFILKGLWRLISVTFKVIGFAVKKSKERRREKQEKELEHERKKRRRAEERKRRESGELPDNVWTDDRNVKPKRKQKRLKPPDLDGNVNPNEVDAYLDSIDWNSVDWSKLDGSNG